MNIGDSFRRAFHPTPEEELEDLRRHVEIHNWAKSEKHCSTCTKWTPPPPDLPGFVEDHGECSDGHTVDTVKNCPDYVCSGDQCMNDIFSRIKELEKLQNSVLRSKGGEEETTYEAYIPGTNMTATFTLPAHATIYEKRYEAHEALRRKYMSNVHFRKRKCCIAK